MVSFVETMRGSVRDANGREEPVEFTIKAEAAGSVALARGTYNVSGIIRLEPWAPETLATGTLKITAVPARIAYFIAFRSTSGERMTLTGVKNVSALNLLHSMTVLPVTVKNAAGDEVAHGEMRFDMKDLVPFLSSWVPLGRSAQRALDTERVALEHRMAGT